MGALSSLAASLGSGPVERSLSRGKEGGADLWAIRGFFQVFLLLFLPLEHLEKRHPPRDERIRASPGMSFHMGVFWGALEMVLHSGQLGNCQGPRWGRKGHSQLKNLS